MPIPKPHKGEERSKYISRCISTVSRVDPNRPHKQVIAICHDTWRRSKNESLSCNLCNLSTIEIPEKLCSFEEE